MSYAAAVDHLYARGLELAPGSPSAMRRKFDLEHMRVLAATLGDPQKSFPSILIAGTNGKGSTAATLASILNAAGYRTGLYTSPHLTRVNERVQVYGDNASGDKTGGSQISDDDFARLYFKVDSAAEELVASGRLPHHPSFFETLTALAFCYYAERKVDIAVLEVGLGGRLDATNIVDPLISIITDISLDHQDYLGNTIAAITREKAGILRPQGTLITLPQHPEANQAIGEAAAALELHAISAANYVVQGLGNREQGIEDGLGSLRRVPHPSQFYREGWDERTAPGTTSADVVLKGRGFSHADQPVPGEGALAPEVALPRKRYTVTVGGQPLTVDSPLIGQHQQRNIALAIAAAEELRNPQGYTMAKSNPKSYKISTGAIEKGIRETRWPGRLELVPLKGSAPLLLDVAHNPAGAWTLRWVIAHLPESQPRTLIFSCLRDKDLREMAQILLPLFDASSDRPRDRIIFAPIHSPRAASLEDLAAVARELEIPAVAAASLKEALTHARAATPADGLIVATGSVYLVGELRGLALGNLAPALGSLAGDGGAVSA